ncbi:MAG: hypothetical protein IJD57_04960 [Candidatus Gastranaerophilales bacterium]|nr:hypothetical protein [Candidatus Gastranaerophilales bacterium]
MRANTINNQTNFKALSPFASSLGAFHNANATIPTLAIETGVTLGRSFEANKRGGKIEATERFVEQGISALVWIYGVQTLKKMGDFVGKNILKIEDLNFDVGRDILRNPIKNNKISKKAAAFKVGNILTATTLATAFIGFVLPKINHFITNKTLKKEKNIKQTTLKAPSMSEFQNNLKTNKNISFTSLIDKGISLAHTLENNSTARLLITDTGVVGGRFKNGRNKYEKIEGLFRDISSIYFYLFSTKHCVNLFNKLAQNKDINPEVVKNTTKMLEEALGDKTISAQGLKELLNENITKENLEKLEGLFKEKEVISLEKFFETFDETQKAYDMTKLQPFFEQNPVLSKTQAKDVLSNSISSDPKFLKETMNLATKGASDDKLKFVSKKHLESLRKQIDDFIEQISQTAQKEGKEIDKNYIQNIAKKNISKNFAFYTLATGISIFALGILIPKVQYFITKKLTKENDFPGIKEYK